MPVSVHHFAAQQFNDLDPSVRVVVLQPNFTQQHTVLADFLRQPGVLYVRLDGQDLSDEALQRQIEAALSEQLQTADLSSVEVLVLDEFDRAGASAEALLPQLALETVGKRVVLLSRRVPFIVMDDSRLRAVTRFIPEDSGLLLWDYTRNNTSETALLEVRALGAGRVQLNGRPVENWDGVLPRSLFFYLVDRGMTTRSEIFETFWPNLTTREATNVFHVTKRKISEVLGIDLTVYWSGFYHIASGVELSYDAALFSTAVQDSAVVPHDDAAVLLKRALALYRGDFLTSIDMPWVHKRRLELRQTYGEALVALAKATERMGESRRALGLYLRAATTNRHREDLALSIMRLYHEMNLDGDALQVYGLLKTHLKKELGVAPAPQVEDLAMALRGGANGD